MLSKRMFTKRFGALVAAALGITEPVGALTSEPPPAGTLAIDTAGEPQPAADDSSSRETVPREPRSAVANGTYKPAAVTSRATDSVVTARLDPTIVTMTGLPSGFAVPVHDLLSRYDSVSLDRLHQVAGGAALTEDGPEGCGVIVGDIDTQTLRRELAGDVELTQESGVKAGFSRFKAEQTNAAIGVRADEVVIAYAPSISGAVTHRDAGIDGRTIDSTPTATDYGPLPSLLHGDATVCVDLGAQVRESLRRTLTEAPEALRTAVDAAAAVGVGCTVAPTGSERGTPRSATPAALRDDSVDSPRMTFRYGAVADPKRLDRETAEAIARAARDGESSFSDTTVSRHGRTVTLDAATDDSVFAPHTTLAGIDVGDIESLSDL